jgi:hypothetical protein
MGSVTCHTRSCNLDCIRFTCDETEDVCSSCGIEPYAPPLMGKDPTAETEGHLTRQVSSALRSSAADEPRLNAQ